MSDSETNLPKPAPVERIQQNLLAAAERRLLNWLCARLPAWVTPDMMTGLGFSAAMVTAGGYVLSNWHPAWLWLSIIGYFVNWFGDSLDGSLARFRKIERPNYGYFIDHSADSLANTILVTCIGLSPYIRLDLALLALAGYLLLSIHTFISARVAGEFRLSYVGGGPTELRILLVILSIAMYVMGPRPLGAISGWTVFDGLVAVMAAGMIIIYIVQTLSMAAKLRARGK